MNWVIGLGVLIQFISGVASVPMLICLGKRNAKGRHYAAYFAVGMVIFIGSLVMVILPVRTYPPHVFLAGSPDGQARAMVVWQQYSRSRPDEITFSIWRVDEPNRKITKRIDPAMLRDIWYSDAELMWDDASSTASFASEYREFDDNPIAASLSLP